VPSQGLLSVTSPLSGTVEKILVRSGQAVHKETPLLEIASHLDSPKFGMVNALIEHSLKEEVTVMRRNLRSEGRLV